MWSFGDADVATLEESIPVSSHPLLWLRKFLREELAPYDGRAFLVARLATAATLVMIISMTFRTPYGAYAALFALTLSRESLGATAAAVRTLAAAAFMSPWTAGLCRPGRQDPKG